MINKNSKIFLAGHNGMIGSAILRKFKNLKYKNIILKDKKDLDLRDQLKVFNFLKNKARGCNYSCCKSWRNKCK